MTLPITSTTNPALLEARRLLEAKRAQKLQEHNEQRARLETLVDNQPAIWEQDLRAKIEVAKSNLDTKTLEAARKGSDTVDALEIAEFSRYYSDTPSYPRFTEHYHGIGRLGLVSPPSKPIPVSPPTTIEQATLQLYSNLYSNFVTPLVQSLPLYTQNDDYKYLATLLSNRENKTKELLKKPLEEFQDYLQEKGYKKVRIVSEPFEKEGNTSKSTVYYKWVIRADIPFS